MRDKEGLCEGVVGGQIWVLQSRTKGQRRNCFKSPPSPVARAAKMRELTSTEEAAATNADDDDDDDDDVDDEDEAASSEGAVLSTPACWSLSASMRSPEHSGKVTEVIWLSLSLSHTV